MPVVLGKQRGKRVLGKRKNTGFWKGLTTVTVVLPVVTGINEM